MVPRTILFLCLLFAAPIGASDTGAGTILVVGDSLSAGYGVARSESWVALASARLAAQGYGYRVINASISGDTTRGGLARLPRALTRHSPSLVVIELGGNDGLRGIPIAELRANLTAMIEAARASGAEVLLIGIRLPPNYGPVYTEKFRSSYHELAEDYGVPLVPFLLDGVALEDGLMQPDGIHPNAAGHRRLLENVWPFLCEWLPAC